jgi:hypothetical protein
MYASYPSRVRSAYGEFHGVAGKSNAHYFGRSLPLYRYDSTLQPLPAQYRGTRGLLGDLSDRCGPLHPMRDTRAGCGSQPRKRLHNFVLVAEAECFFSLLLKKPRSRKGKIDQIQTQEPISSPTNLAPQSKSLEPHPLPVNQPLDALRPRNARPAPHQRSPVADLGGGTQVATVRDQLALPARDAPGDVRVGAEVRDGLFEIRPVGRDEDDVGLGRRVRVPPVCGDGGPGIGVGEVERAGEQWPHQVRGVHEVGGWWGQYDGLAGLVEGEPA